MDASSPLLIRHRGIRPTIADDAWIAPNAVVTGDTEIGAKSSINFNGFKNQLGSFHSPSRVVICDAFIRTLSDDDVRSGYGEIFKLFLIGSREEAAPLRVDGECLSMLEQPEVHQAVVGTRIAAVHRPAQVQAFDLARG